MGSGLAGRPGWRGAKEAEGGYTGVQRGPHIGLGIPGKVAGRWI